METALREYLDNKFQVMEDKLYQVQTQLNSLILKVDELSQDNTGNKKDIEFNRTNIEAIREEHRLDQDKIWEEIRRSHNECAANRSCCTKKMEKSIIEKVKAGNNSVKLWVALAVLSASGSLITVVLSFLLK